MPHPALDLLAAKAKLAGAVVLGGVVATAAIGGGALSLVADSSGATTEPATCVTPSAPASTEVSTEPSTEAAATPTDTTCPTSATTVTVTESPEAEDADDAAETAEAPEAPEAPEAEEAEDDAKTVLNHATVVSIDATTLVVTAEGATTTWTLSADTRFTGAIKDPTQILPGMVIHLRGTDGAATHVITPGKNKPDHVKPTHDKPVKDAKPAKATKKTAQGKQS